jgi:hypothetical protein
VASLARAGCVVRVWRLQPVPHLLDTSGGSPRVGRDAGEYAGGGERGDKFARPKQSLVILGFMPRSHPSTNAEALRHAIIEPLCHTHEKQSLPTGGFSGQARE